MNTVTYTHMQRAHVHTRALRMRVLNADKSAIDDGSCQQQSGKQWEQDDSPSVLTYAHSTHSLSLLCSLAHS